MLRTDDSRIRALLKQELGAIHGDDPDTVIIEELGLLHGSCRADVVVVNGMMHAFELKSDRDTLYRLPEQVNAYTAVFDLVTLVVGERHVLAAIELVPAWWGIRVARVGSGSLVFRNLKLPTPNPCPDPMSVARLLWRDEALSILEGIDTRKSNYSKSREWLYAELVALLAFDLLKEGVRRSLKNRPSRRPAGRQASCDG